LLPRRVRDATVAIGITVIDVQFVVTEYFATFATITEVIVKTIITVRAIPPLDMIGTVPIFDRTALTLKIGFVETRLTIGTTPNFLTIVLLGKLATFVAGEPTVPFGTIETTVEIAPDPKPFREGGRFVAMRTL
jgi:hypothetical protein